MLARELLGLVELEEQLSKLPLSLHAQHADEIVVTVSKCAANHRAAAIKLADWLLKHGRPGSTLSLHQE